MELRDGSFRGAIILRDQNIKGINFILVSTAIAFNPLIRVDLFYKGRKYINLIYGHILPLKMITDWREERYNWPTHSINKNANNHYFINFNTAYNLKGNDRLEIYNYGSPVHDDYKYGIDPIVSDGGEYDGVKRVINNEFPNDKLEVKLEGKFESFTINYNNQAAHLKEINIRSKRGYKTYNTDQQAIICDLYCTQGVYACLPKDYLKGNTEVGIKMDGMQSAKVNWTYIERL